MSMEDDYRRLIINTPKLQTLRHRFSSSFLTFFFWTFWFYLWLPVVSIIAWFLGFRFFYDHMIDLGGVKGFLQITLNYVIVVFIIALIFFGWAYYNNRRFKNKKRRGKFWKISFKNLAERYQLDEEQVLHCKASRRMVVHFNEQGKISKINNPTRDPLKK